MSAFLVLEIRPDTTRVSVLGHTMIHSVLAELFSAKIGIQLE